MSKKTAIIGSVVIAAIIISTAFLIRAAKTPPVSGPVIPTPGAAGSEHSHMRMLVFVHGEQVDFVRQKYMLRSPLVHFEDDEGTVIHKHATGITLPYFFKTLGMELTKDCLISDDGGKFCTGGKDTLKIYINRELANDKIDKYELKPGDKILVNYGNENDVDIALRLNAIKDIDPDL